MKSVRLFWFISVLSAAGTCIAQNNPIPFIDQPLVPAAAQPSGPGFTLTVNGAGFVSGAIVNWNGTPLATAFVSAGKLTAVVPATDIATNGTAMVTVVNPGPGGGSSDPASFSITAPASSLVFRSSAVGGTTTPMGVVTADFNHDGIADLAVIDQAPAPSCNYQFHGVGSIAILLGNGDGSFTRASTLCVLDFLGAEPTTLALSGDLNRDGNVDLIAVSNSVDFSHVAAYYGNGDGTFSAPQELGTGGPYPSAMVARPLVSTNLYQYIKGIALGDFYRNGQLNVAESQITSMGETELFLLPEFNFLILDPSGHPTGALVAGDFNGDGNLDVVDEGKTFLGDGAGTFTEKPNAPTGAFGSTMVEGDFNGDGILDLASVNGNSIAIELGNGDGTFTAKAGQPLSAQSNVLLISADFNGDGKLDLATVDSANTVSIWLGNGDGTFQSPVDTTGRGDGLAAGDFNGDGRMDLVVTNSAGGTVTILLQGSPYSASVEPPIDADGSSNFWARRLNLPVKFTLFYNGVPTCTMPPATIAVTRTEGKNPGPVSENVYATPADKGSNFRIDRSACQYVYNLGAAGMGAGTYRVDISIDEVRAGDAVLTLRDFHR